MTLESSRSLPATNTRPRRKGTGRTAWKPCRRSYKPIIPSNENYMEKQLTLKCETMMSMDVQSVKIDLIHWLTELEDKSVLEQIQGLKEKQESSFELNAEQGKELDSR